MSPLRTWRSSRTSRALLAATCAARHDGVVRNTYFENVALKVNVKLNEASRLGKDWRVNVRAPSGL